MTTGMNEKIRDTARRALKAKKLRQADVAEQIGLSQPEVARLLTGRVGKVPEAWQKLLDALGLELVAVPKDQVDVLPASLGQGISNIESAHELSKEQTDAQPASPPKKTPDRAS